MFDVQSLNTPGKLAKPFRDEHSPVRCPRAKELRSPPLSLSTFFGPHVPRDVVNFATLSTWPVAQFATLGVATARRANLSCQLASKLALERYVDTIRTTSRQFRFQKEQAQGAAMLEEAVLQSNHHIYEFAHKLAAGGKTASSLLGVVWGRGIVSVTRCGEGSAFLVRDEQLFPFFDSTNLPKDDEYLGVSTKPYFDISSVKTRRGDILVLFSETISPLLQRNLVHLTDRIALHYNHPDQLARWLFAHPNEQRFVILTKLGHD